MRWKSYPEKHLCHGLLCCLRKAPQVVVQRRVHHAGVHGGDGDWEAPSAQLLLQVVGEEDQAQFALGVSAVGTVAFPADRGEKMREGPRIWTARRLQGCVHLLFRSSISMIPE